MTLRLVLVFCVAHVGVLWIAFSVWSALYSFFFYPRDTNSPLAATTRAAEAVCLAVPWLLAGLLWTTPLWAVLWAWIYTRFRNRLFLARPGRYCLHCGYNLTGNVSGRCPECGETVWSRLTG